MILSIFFFFFERIKKEIKNKNKIKKEREEKEEDYLIKNKIVAWTFSTPRTKNTTKYNYKNWTYAAEHATKSKPWKIFLLLLFNTIMSW